MSGSPDPLDFEALEAAGIANPRERADLIKYLDDLGFTLEEMAEAERRGRLFGLAGDVLQWPGPPIYTLTAAGEQLGLSADDIAHIWALLGLTVAGPDVPTLSQADVDALATWLAVKSVVGEDGAFGLLRVLGAAMARLAEAESTMIRAGTPDIQMTYTNDELATAQAYRAVAEFVPRIGTLIDIVHRHHLTSARTHFEGVTRDASASVVCGIGFADLSSFTVLTQTLTPTELQGLLNEFGAAVADVVHADGGRVVKFIGDAVMWVSSTPQRLAQAAVDLVHHPRAREEGLQVRAGLAYGTALAINGDYFGTPVNLAARLVAAAAPGQVLADAALHDQLPDWPTIPQGKLTLKGFDDPVNAFELQGSADRPDGGQAGPRCGD
ncbi:adenylate/guanylate cyclase domain-containing protein [Mycobacterium marinum]|uniref:adenylate/guanylate cyclase domain-containing protein n=1 Tax=Mycobacterium marinum TaxID=1781 RepID=UPI00356A035E